MFGNGVTTGMGNIVVLPYHPTEPSSGTYRVLRGASWFNSTNFCRVANRDITAPGDTYGAIGFRIVIAQ
jgi:formylglycine-generating enzyme required for sulfatase activity